MSVCLYRINVKTAEPIGPKKILSLGRFIDGIEKYCLKIILIFQNSRKKNEQQIEVTDGLVKNKLLNNYYFFTCSLTSDSSLLVSKQIFGTIKQTLTAVITQQFSHLDSAQKSVNCWQVSLISIISSLDVVGNTVNCFLEEVFFSLYKQLVYLVYKNSWFI